MEPKKVEDPEQRWPCYVSDEVTECSVAQPVCGPEGQSYRGSRQQTLRVPRALAQGQQKAPEQHLPGPCGLTVEMHWGEGCCWNAFRDRQYLSNRHQLLIALVPRT